MSNRFAQNTLYSCMKLSNNKKFKSADFICSFTPASTHIHLQHVYTPTCKKIKVIKVGSMSAIFPHVSL